MALLSVCAYQRKVLTELGTSLLGPIEAFGEWVSLNRGSRGGGP